MLISPTERPPITGLGKTSSRPERYGADILMLTRAGIIGVQRKEIRDFIASVQDGRLSKEVAQLSACRYAILIIEGEPSWTLDGELYDSYTRWSRASHEALILSLHAKDIWVLSSENPEGTCRLVRGIEKWAGKPEHQALMRRPKPAGAWGTTGHHDFDLHLLQSFDGIGPGVAEKLLQKFGGVPLAWTVSEDELRSVPGIGKVRARKLIEALTQTGATPDSTGGPSATG